LRFNRTGVLSTYAIPAMMAALGPIDPPARSGPDPDDYRMTLGEHLEELRRRLILSLIGVGIALAICLYFGDSVVTGFCLPLLSVLEKYKINTQLVADEVSEGFAVFIRISVISAIALSSPWILYQLWLFIAAGLYPGERKYVTRYLPLSMGLLISGMLFVYFFVLPWTLDFFVGFNSKFSVPRKARHQARCSRRTRPAFASLQPMARSRSAKCSARAAAACPPANGCAATLPPSAAGARDAAGFFLPKAGAFRFHPPPAE